jgi:hypothetical protein
MLFVQTRLDLKRAYRQFPIDPGDYRFLGYSWRNQLYFDKERPMRSAISVSLVVMTLSII